MKRFDPVRSRRLAFSAALFFFAGSLTLTHAAPTPAAEADRFVASTSVATHWRFQNVYQNYAGLSDKVIDSGIRHVRDTGTSRDFIAKLQKFADAGVKSIITMNPPSGTRPNSSYWANPPALNIDAFVSLTGREVVAFAEMNNELDMPSQRGATYWASLSEPLSDDPLSPYYYFDYSRESTADAWAQLAASSDPAINSLPLVGPSFTTDGAYSTAGDLSAVIEYSNIHHYLYGWNPETTNIRGIDHATTNQSQVQAPGKGMITTEGGGATAASLMGNWPLTAHGRYLPRYYLAHFVKGFAVTTAYEFVDEGVDPANQEKNFGLLKNDLSEKPAYTAVKNVLSVLSDPGVAFAPADLNYTLSGSTTNVWSALFQKRNGDYYLCLWIGLPCYSPLTGSTIAVSNQSVSLALPAAIVSARAFTLDDAGAMTSSAVTITSNAISLSLTDRVTIVRLSTNASGGIASSPAGLRATPGNGQVELKWAPVGEATSYTVKHATTSDGSYSTVVSGLTSPTYLHTGLTNGTLDYYVVTATSAGGESAPTKPISAVPFASVILDNAAGSGVTLTGAWTTSTSTPGYYGTNFLHDANTGSTGGRAVRFTPTIATAGNYDVYLRWPANSNRASNTPIEVVSSEGAYATTTNQQLNSNTWTLLGTFKFAAGTSGYVTIKNDGANGFVIADAVRLELTRPRPPTGLTVASGASPVVLAWDAVTGATSYTVKRAPDPTGPYTVLARGLTATTYNDTTAAANTVYYYTVSTTNAGGESSDSFPISGAASVEVIVDNSDSTKVTKTGTWNASSFTAGYYGSDYLHDNNTGGTGGKQVAFAPALPLAGDYQVYLRWTTEPNRADNVPVDIVHAGGTSSVSVNQKTNHATWVLLGTYSFDPGAVAVKVRNDSANGFVVADAVKFVLN